MRVVMVSGHACIRVQKMALPLIQAGHKVHLVARKVPSFVENYASFHLYNDVEQLLETLKLFENHADVFHCHNEPSWFVTAIKEISDIPVVLDIHDTYLTRISPEDYERKLNDGEYPIRITAEERLNIQLADGIVNVNEAVRDRVDAEFAPKVPSIVLPSYLPKMLYRYDLKEWLGGIVYEGKVVIPSELKRPNATGFEYCEYTEFARQCKEIGLNLHLYGARKDEPYMKAYEDYAFCHPPVSFNSLTGAISRHDWGFIGNVFYTSQWEHAMPNKLFDYMAACVPVVVMNAKYSSDFVEKYGIGITVNSLSELAKRWSEHRRCRENVVKLRQKFSMDNNIHVLEDLYRRVCEGRGE